MKIALKHGVQLKTSERMAEEIKVIIFYTQHKSLHKLPLKSFYLTRILYFLNFKLLHPTYLIVFSVGYFYSLCHFSFIAENGSYQIIIWSNSGYRMFLDKNII